MKSNEFTFHWSPQTPEQKEAAQLFRTHDLLFLLGCAGSGKTHCAISLALQSIKQGHHKKLIFVRPLVEAGEKVGFLPGELNEKVQPYLGPLNHILSKVAFNIPKGIVEIQTLAFMRGLTFDDCVIVADESQNMSTSQLKLLLTRMGKNCKVLVCGDQDQSDIHGRGDDLLDVAEKLEDVQGVVIIDFYEDGILRHPLVREVVKRL